MVAWKVYQNRSIIHPTPEKNPADLCQELPDSAPCLFLCDLFLNGQKERNVLRCEK